VENANTFTVTLPTITDVLTGTASSFNGDPAESFTLWVGRGYDGDVTFSAADGIDGLGGDDISPYVSTFTVAAGTWIKVVGWKSASTSGNYLIERSPYGDLQPIDAGLTSIAGLTTAADKMIYTDGADSYAVADLTSAGRDLLDDADASAQRTTLGLVIGTDVAPIASPTFTGTPSADTASAGTNTTQLATTAFVTTAVAAGGGGGGFSYNAVNTATTAQAQNHYAVTGTTTITLPAASGVTSGQEVRVKNTGTDTVTITRSSTDTIDAQTSITMAVQYQALSFVSNGSDGWEII
jgi:hypothetical protein